MGPQILGTTSVQTVGPVGPVGTVGIVEEESVGRETGEELPTYEEAAATGTGNREGREGEVPQSGTTVPVPEASRIRE